MLYNTSLCVVRCKGNGIILDAACFSQMLLILYKVCSDVWPCVRACAHACGRARHFHHTGRSRPVYLQLLCVTTCYGLHNRPGVAAAAAAAAAGAAPFSLPDGVGGGYTLGCLSLPRSPHRRRGSTLTVSFNRRNCRYDNYIGVRLYVKWSDTVRFR